MTSKEAMVVADGLTRPTTEALKWLGKVDHAKEEACRKKYKRWGHFRNALERRHLLAFSKGAYRLNANGKKVLGAL